MFELNKLVTTKKGEKLTPFLVQNGMVYCFLKNGNSVVRKLEDFSFEKPKEKNVIVVTPVLEESDELFETEEETTETEETEEETTETETDNTTTTPTIEDDDYI